MAKKNSFPKAQKLKSGGKPLEITQMVCNQFCLDRTKALMKEHTILSMNELCGYMGFHRKTIQRAIIELIETGYIMDIANSEYEYID